MFSTIKPSTLKGNKRIKILKSSIELFNWIIFIPCPSLPRFYKYWKKLKRVFKTNITISHSQSDSCIALTLLGAKDRQVNCLWSCRFLFVLDLITICLYDWVFPLKFWGCIPHNTNKFIQNTTVCQDFFS